MSIRLLKRWWLAAVSANNAIAARAVMANMRRLRYASLIAIPVHVAHIVIFSLATPASPRELLWRDGIVLAHSLLLIIMLAIACAAWLLRKRAFPNFWAYLAQYGFIAAVITAGVAIVAVDQLVTSNITPFLIVCMVLAGGLLMRPAFALVLYSIAFGLFWHSIGLTQSDPAILMSNRVNGITATGFAFCLSLIVWNTYRQNVRQQDFIERQQTELEDKNKALELLAASDPLTGLFNRRSFEKLVERELHAVHASHTSPCLIIMDIDRFKEVNDRYGHPFGDRLLKGVAAILKQNLREQDLISRWGGEEFVILLPRTRQSDALAVAEHLRAAIASRHYELDRGHVSFTASFGVAKLDPTRRDAFIRAYRQADEALYRAKQSGRNRVEPARRDPRAGPRYWAKETERSV